MALLEVRDLHVFYGNIEALKGISLQVDPGQIVAILGGNGAGKTTTLRTISGLLRPRSGSITYGGKSLIGMEAHLIVALGLSHVPEGRRIFNILTVAENLNLGGYLIRSDRKLVDERKAAIYKLFPRLAERRTQLAGCARLPRKALQSCWWSRTRARRWRSRTALMSSRSGASCSKVRRRPWRETRGFRRLTSVALSRSALPDRLKTSEGRSKRPSS